MFKITTTGFYGPFDLLLDLIQKSKINIYDIKISEITNQYINSIKNLDLSADETADFILIATQLLYIKTKSLIKDTLVEEEVEEELISREELIRRLVEYKKIKSIIDKFKNLQYESQKKFFKLQEDLTQFSTTEELIEYDLNIIKKSLENLILLSNEKEIFEVDKIVNRDEYSLEKYNTKLKYEIIKKGIMSITRILQKVNTKSEAIVIFLSILELSKQKYLTIIQDDITNEIIVKISDNILKKDVEEIDE